MGTLSTDTVNQVIEALLGGAVLSSLLCSGCLALAPTIGSPTLFPGPKCEQGERA